eukprot:scaffold2229_cov262-Pinguiococcus_pyrenoidosus.AAC.16
MPGSWACASTTYTCLAEEVGHGRSLLFRSAATPFQAMLLLGLRRGKLDLSPSGKRRQSEPDGRQRTQHKLGRTPKLPVNDPAMHDED